jgi:hypothetical protein
MHVPAAVGAGEAELLKAPFEFGLGFQEFETEHLGRDRDRVIGREAGIHPSMRLLAFAACSEIVVTARSRMSRSDGVIGECYAPTRTVFERLRLIHIPDVSISPFLMKKK